MNKFVKVLAMLMALMLCVGLTACSSKQGNGDAAVNYSLGLTTDGRFDGITAKDYVTIPSTSTMWARWTVWNLRAAAPMAPAPR